MDQVKFALKIKEARKEKGWTQKELATRLKITDKAVSKWERALSMPDIELLGPISKELDIPLAELLNVEDVIREGQEDTTETLLRKLLPLMKEKVHQEIKKKKKLLYRVIAVFLILSLIAFLYPQIEYYFRAKEYRESKEIIPYGELVINQIDEQNDIISIDISKPADINPLGIYTRYWRDKNNSEIAYFQFFYYEKPWLIYDSMEEYVEAELTGYTLPRNLEIDRPVSKIIYVDTQEHTLWEASLVPFCPLQSK